MAQLSQVKMRLPELHVDGRCAWYDDLCFSIDHAKPAEKRPNHGAVPLGFTALRQQ
jgi:hypothetical protein